jgi:hypothetical protein
MAKNTVRRQVECTNPQCGGDIFERTWNFDHEPALPVWRCCNCGTEVKRTAVRRKTNHAKAIDAVIAIRKAWSVTDEALRQLVNAGTVMSGELLVHASTFNYHLNKLSDNDKPTNWEIEYYAREARLALEKAKAFVQEKTRG